MQELYQLLQLCWDRGNSHILCPFQEEIAGRLYVPVSDVGTITKIQGDQIINKFPLPANPGDAVYMVTQPREGTDAEEELHLVHPSVPQVSTIRNLYDQNNYTLFTHS